jgi:hypothetical protein
MANRQTRRKRNDYSKKKTNNRKVVVSTPDESMPKLIKIGTVVVVIFVAFYILTLSLTQKQNSNDTTNNNDTSTPATIQYDEILAGETFNMPNSEYYVLLYDFSDETISTLYGGIISSFKTNHKDSRLYIVDLSKGFSSAYIADASNSSVQRIEDLKIKGPTVIKISNGQNVAYVEGKDAIKDILK